LKRASGTQFDPAVVQAFVQVAERYGTDLIINSAREIVEKQNARRDAQPEAPKSPNPRREVDPGLSFA
jgi:HD-GYP domain-containing protein (c-di-GMP phosphodiesterase class II)